MQPLFAAIHNIILVHHLAGALSASGVLWILESLTLTHSVFKNGKVYFTSGKEWDTSSADCYNLWPSRCLRRSLSFLRKMSAERRGSFELIISQSRDFTALECCVNMFTNCLNPSIKEPLMLGKSRN